MNLFEFLFEMAEDVWFVPSFEDYDQDYHIDGEKQ